jgi:hypothetical protein
MNLEINEIISEINIFVNDNEHVLDNTDVLYEDWWTINFSDRSFNVVDTCKVYFREEEDVLLEELCNKKLIKDNIIYYFVLIK